MKLREDLFDLSLDEPIFISDTEVGLNPPEEKFNGEASLLIDLIGNTWEFIQKYNDAIQNISEPQVIEVLKGLVSDENSHIGSLQECLKIYSPNTGVIEQGRVEAENQLQEPER